MRRPEPSDFYRKGDLVMPEPTTELAALEWLVSKLDDLAEEFAFSASSSGLQTGILAGAYRDAERSIRSIWQEADVALAKIEQSRPAVGEGLRAVRAKVEAERDKLPALTLQPGEVLHTDDKGTLYTEVQRGSVRGQSVALSWVMHEIDASLAADKDKTHD